MTSRPTVLASIVLALALPGDSLLYAVLPLHAATFGISLAWVGVLLSANRIVRLVVYPLLARMAAAGLRRFTIGAAALGAMSTFSLAFASGGWALLASRLAWGVAFGSLSLSALAYATLSHAGAGRRVGLSLSLRELGPLMALTAGVVVVTALGVRPALFVLGVPSLLGVCVAMVLPDAKIDRSGAPRTRLRWPGGSAWLSLVAGFVMDGIFPATIALLLAQSSGTNGAIVGAGMALAFKRIATVLLAPAGGHAADRFGGRTATAVGFAIAAGGAISIASGSVIAGTILLSCGGAITAAAIPLSVTEQDAETRVRALANLGMARDAGAAAGPLVALTLSDAAGTAGIYAAAAALLGAMAIRSATSGFAMRPTTSDHRG